MDRTSTKTTDAGGAKEKVTTFNYLGLSSEVLDEEVAGELTKSYQYSPWGQRLSQVTHKDDGTEEEAYYGYNPHTDVEQLTDATGNTKATYGYTAYGKDNEAEFTGIDKPDAADPTKEPYNAYRFNAKRWDQASGSYDMGFRDYSPGLNRFLSRDSYNGALADMNLGLNPWTGNRYAFGGGNPISNVELDGHIFLADDGGGTQISTPPAVANTRLHNILTEGIYARPGVSSVVGNGEVSTAIRNELQTGTPTEGLWHYQKGANSFVALSDLLEADRKARLKGAGTLSDADRNVAEQEARKLWGALNADDVAGGFTRAISQDSDNYNKTRGALQNAVRNAAVSGIVGSQWEPKTYNGKVVGMTQTSPAAARGVAKGMLMLEVAVFAVDIYNYGFGGAVDRFLGSYMLPGMSPSGGCQNAPMNGYDPKYQYCYG